MQNSMVCFKSFHSNKQKLSTHVVCAPLLQLHYRTYVLSIEEKYVLAQEHEIHIRLSIVRVIE